MIRDPDSLGRDIPGGWTEGDGKGGPATEGVTFLHRDKKLKIPWAKSVTPPLEPCSFSERMKQIPGENVGYYACVAIRKPLDVLVIKRDPPTKKMAQGWRVLDVTRAAEEWVAGSAPNQGIMVCGIDDVAWNMWVACREHKDAKARPMLRITYVPPADTDADKKPGAAGWWRWHPPFHRGKAGGERWGPA
jgi:hypothetical protein